MKFHLLNATIRVENKSDLALVVSVQPSGLDAVDRMQRMRHAFAVAISLTAHCRLCAACVADVAACDVQHATCKLYNSMQHAMGNGRRAKGDMQCTARTACELSSSASSADWMGGAALLARIAIDEPERRTK